MKVGVAKTDITAFKEGVAMLGYGQPGNIMTRIETRLYARAFVFETAKEKIAYVHCELCFITQSLKRGVVEKLKNYGYTDHNILLNAQHTHSAPGGFSYYGLYNAATPGFVQEIYDKLVESISQSIVNAEKALQAVELSLAKGEFELDKEVGFQRSLKAYLQNPEAKKIDKNSLHLGINREMKMLKVKTTEGKNLALINWFGTHPTNLSNDNNSLCSDNKGYAAQYTEEALGEGFVAAFANGSCADVTPKFIFNKKHPRKRGKWEGKYSDDIESAKYNGTLQFEKAKEIYLSQEEKAIELGAVDSILRYVDFRTIDAIPEKFTNGVKNAQTSPSCFGVSFFYGTEKDGLGMEYPLYQGGKVVARLMKGIELLRAPFSSAEWAKQIKRKYKAQGKKDIIIESGDRKILGAYNVSGLIVPSWADETVFALKEFHRKGAFDKHPWTQQILPLQIIKIGNLALVAFPFEITTIAAQRLQKTMEDVLLGNGFDEVVLSPYSNSYAGYVTTYEEYQVQAYEGGHTVFGEWTLAALQSELEKLAIAFLKPKNQRNENDNVQPRHFTEEDLEGFRYYDSKTYKKYLKKKNEKG